MGGVGSGGFRENAGRKPGGASPCVCFSLSIESNLLCLLRDEAARECKSVSEHIVDLIEKGLKS